MKKEEVDFTEVDEFDDKTCRGAKGFGSTGLKFFFSRKKMSGVIVNDLNETVVFFSVNGEEKKTFILNLIEKQFQIAAFLANKHREILLLSDLEILMKHIKNSEAVQILSDRLVGVITLNEFIKIMIEVLDRVLQ